MKRFPIFKQNTKFELGKMFKDKFQIGDAIKEYEMDKKHNIILKKMQELNGSKMHGRLSLLFKV